MCVEFGALSTLKICQNESICVVFLRASLLLFQIIAQPINYPLNCPGIYIARYGLHFKLYG